MANMPDNDVELFIELTDRADRLREEMAFCDPPARPRPTLVWEQ